MIGYDGHFNMTATSVLPRICLQFGYQLDINSYRLLCSIGNTDNYH